MPWSWNRSAIPSLSLTSSHLSSSPLLLPERPAASLNSSLLSPTFHVCECVWSWRRDVSFSLSTLKPNAQEASTRIRKNEILRLVTASLFPLFIPITHPVYLANSPRLSLFLTRAGFVWDAAVFISIINFVFTITWSDPVWRRGVSSQPFLPSFFYSASTSTLKSNPWSWLLWNRWKLLCHWKYDHWQVPVMIITLLTKPFSFPLVGDLFTNWVMYWQMMLFSWNICN